MFRSAHQRLFAVLVFASLAALVAYVLAGRPTIAPEPTSAGSATARPTTLPAGHTEHDYRRALLAFNRRTLVDAYRASGHRDKRWDANAIAFLEAMAMYFTYAGVDRHYAQPNTPTMEQLIRLSDAAILNTGCDDPLLAYCYGVLLHDTLRIDAAEPVLAKWAERLEGSRYPAYRVQAAWGRLHRLRVQKETNAGTAAALEKAYEAMVRMVTEKGLGATERRIYFEHIKDELRVGSVKRQAQFIERLDKSDSGADPWLYHMLAGQYRINAAWTVRGKAFAGEVAREAWDPFGDHLRAARDHLVAAWKFDPASPEPAAAMITVAMGAGEALEESPRAWFDRAVAAQADYGPAYSNYLWNLRPRWGGSHSEMYDFGLECLRSDRYDTRIPFQFVFAMERIANDRGDGRFWRQAGVYDRAANLFERQRSVATGAQDRGWYAAYHAAVAWRNDKFAEARRLLDEAGQDPPTHGFDVINVIGRQAMSQTYVMTGPHAAAVARAESRFEQRSDYRAADEAAAIYRDLADRLPAADRGAPFLRGRLAELDWRRRYDTGEWVDIQPDAQMSGWWAMGGAWRVDDQGRLVGTFSQGNQRLVCQGGFIGEDYEFAGCIEFPSDAEPAPAAGPIFAHNSPFHSYGLSLHRRTGIVGLSTGTARIDHKRVTDLPDTCEFLVRVRGGLVTAEVNGEPVFRQHDLRHRLNVTPQRFVGVSGHTSIAKTARFTKLRVRKLNRDGARDPFEPELTPNPSELEPGLLLSRRDAADVVAAARLSRSHGPL